MHASEEPTGWPDDAERNRLIGDWHLYQRQGGHRTSTDDLITAWHAVHRSPARPGSYLDLGCGTGSVLLMVCHKLRPDLAVGIEAQAQSVAMAQRSIAELPADAGDLAVHHSDFRDFDFSGRTYDLITGSPPYFALDAGVAPSDPQKRACRFEARGGVEAYAQAAARALSPTGRFHIVFQAQWSERVVNAASQYGLHLQAQADFRMRADRKDPFLSVFEFGFAPVVSPHRVGLPVRNEAGDISAEYQTIRAELGVGFGAR